MNKKTVGLIALIVTIILCGCPGLLGIVISLGTIRDDPGGALTRMVGDVIWVAIPVAIYFYVFRSKQFQTKPTPLGAGITPAKHDSPESVKELLKAHIVRLNGMYRGKPDEQQSLRFIQQVLNNDLLTFAVDQIAQKIPNAMAEKKVLQSTGTFGEWFMAVSICPWFKPEDVKANLGQGYMELLNGLAGPALNTPGGKNIAHWVYCSNGNQASVHLTMMPNPKGSSKGTVVLAQDLLTPQERQKVGLPPQGGVSTYVESPRKPVPGTCYQCHKSLQGIASGAYSGADMTAMMERIPYACKSCGTQFCANCTVQIKKEKNGICPYCGRNIGW